MICPTDAQFRAAARRLISQGNGADGMDTLHDCLEPDHHGEVQHPHGGYAMVQVWLRVEDTDAAEETP